MDAPVKCDTLKFFDKNFWGDPREKVIQQAIDGDIPVMVMDSS
jgi:hypothetical protein